MPLVVKDRVQETSVTVGTGTLTLLGAVTGFQTFLDAIGSGNTTYYTITDGTNFEVGIGTVTLSTLSRDTVLESSNGGSLVNFGTGTRQVFCTYPAEKSVDTETAQTLTNKTLTNPVINGFTGDTSVVNIGSGQIYKDASGNVGIGTTNPSGRLEVLGGVSNTIANAGTGDAATLTITNSDVSGIGRIAKTLYEIGNLPLASVSGVYTNFNGSNDIGGALAFSTQTNVAGGVVERMRIDNAGNVGIGTNNPSVRLDVIGSIEASAAATQDGIILAGRAGGTSSFATTLTPTTLTASRTITLPDATTTMVGTDTAQTLTNKTLTSPTMIGTLIEDVFTITDGAGFAIDPKNGSIQLVTLGANRTPTVANFAAGEAVTLMINDGTAFTITWSTIGVVWVGGTAPTLALTGFTVIELWRVGSTYYGALVGNVA